MGKDTMTLRARLLNGVAAFGCAVLPAHAETPTPLKVKAVDFTATPAPSNMLEMTQPYTRSAAVVTLADSSKKTFPLSYHVLHRSGDFVSGWYAGLVVDKNNKPILQSAADKKGNIARGPFFSAGADGTSMLVVPNAKVDGVKGHTVFLINHLEYETEADNIDPAKPPVALYAQLPMAMNLTVLDQDPATGKLTPVKMSNVDFSSVDGLWIPCNASTTPWMMHLAGEEYEPNAQYFEQRPRVCDRKRAASRRRGRPRKISDRHQGRAAQAGRRARHRRLFRRLAADDAISDRAVGLT
jgi:hypothetical protein